MCCPRMLYADTSRLGRPFAKDPVVVRSGGRYLMYYSLPPWEPALRPAGAAEGWAIGIAASEDLTNWRKVGEVLPKQECERTGICAPGAIVLDAQVHLFYQTYGSGERDAICHAVSADGLHFARDESNPVFSPTGDWNCGRAIDADVVVWGDCLLMVCATRDPQMKRQMLVGATAPLNSDFGRRTWEQLGEGPALAPVLPWEKDCIEAPALCVQDGRLFMFYAGAYNNEPQQIGCAVSDDGVRWQRLSDDPFLPNGPAGSWNASESGHPGVFVDEDGRTYLCYQGNNDQGRTWYLSCVPIRWNQGRPCVVPDR